jgi:hypothetical protein
VNRSLPDVLDVLPLLLVTVTWTLPDACGGAVATMAVSESTVKDSAASEPKLTLVMDDRLVPVMVTTVPPPVLPEVMLSPVTVGALTEV